MPESQSDEQLMASYTAGNEQAFQELFRRYRSRVFGYLKKYVKDPRVVDDLFQATFLKLHRSRARFDANQLFAAWIFTICRNVVFDYLRGTQRSREDLGKRADSENLAIATEFEPPELEIEELLRMVPEKQREAMRLRYSEGLDFSAIAHRLSTTQENARQLISRAVRTLRQRVKKT